MNGGFAVGDRSLLGTGNTHPDWLLTHAAAGAYRIVVASVVGQKHLELGLPREDAAAVRGAGPWIAVAVADGIGSEPYALHGAAQTVDCLTAAMLRQVTRPTAAVFPYSPGRPPSHVNDAVPHADYDRELGVVEPDAWLAARSLGAAVTPGEGDGPDLVEPGGFRQAASVGWCRVACDADGTAASPPPDLEKSLAAAFSQAHQELHYYAGALRLQETDLGCTALALLFNVETGAGAAAQLGDGGILALTEGGAALDLAQPKAAADPTFTFALDQEDYRDVLAVRPFTADESGAYPAIFVMTDGLTRDLLYAPRDLQAAWLQGVSRHIRSAGSEARAAGDTLNWLARYDVAGVWDDRTLVVITRRESADADRESVAGDAGAAEPTDDRESTG